MNQHTPRVGLFVTCLVDLMRPGIGFASVKLLEDAGCRVEVPEAQTCCGQPAWNSGDRADTAALARQTIEAFEGFDYVVGPSGSCISQLRKYPQLFADAPEWLARAEKLATRSHELTSFLVDVLGREDVQARFEQPVCYHDSCSGLRELGVKAQPRALLASVTGTALREMPESEVCCGFGGTFCVKYPEISTRMAGDKCASIRASGAPVVLGGDLGCLMNIAGRLRRLGEPVRVYHVAEVLADMADGPAIGEEER
ncbi:(Fe-S)-binding protein [Alkalilimnicola sp. S0819]|uniref:(Fe-S)-binding protein n=1 Tax=Alkalilimnicola sp. S0819 TaxID=2613922 RepID=UPI0012622A0F|nr:(Fe-S)-binding protein [Alkalilimnicola sp. S0819]KAB7619573.1 (Fe-S)-binding protein [Alkalilimnicola sp. S0819]MPQ17625.1 (Fe-S)-binding protein [Alkalilimnicola sp. S0819]